MNGTLFLYSLALHLAWMEGKSHGINGILAILFCLRNRVAANQELGDLGRIIQAENFRRMARINTYDVVEIPDIREPVFYQAIPYVEDIFNNTIKDGLTSGALHWGEKPIGGKQIVTQVGQLKLWS